MTFETFNERLEIVKKDFNEIEDNTRDFISGLEMFVADVCGVPQSWLLDIVQNELYNLIVAVNPDLKDEAVKEFIDYYMFELDSFQGEIEVDSKKFDLSDNKDVYEYITQEL